MRIRISAPPDKGQANVAVLALLAKATGLPKSAMTLESGQTSRSKLVAIAGDPQRLAAIPAQLSAR